MLRLARAEFLGAAKLPATAKLIAERCDEKLPETQALRNWFSGQAAFGQKFEVLLPAFTEEVLAPRTLLSMMAAGTLAQLGKAVFFGRVGYQTQRLRLAAEAVSLGVEAPSFVLTDKILASAWTSPDRQWDHLPSDLLSAVLAFGALRGAGFASRRLNRALETSQSLERFAQGRTRIALAEQWIPKAEGLAKAEGRFAAAQRLAGKIGVPALKYLGSTGVSRAWVPSLLSGLSTHGLSLVALTGSNQFSRLVGLREASQQGWRFDLVDDALMYGHLLVSGHFARGLGRDHIDQRLALVEALPLEGKAKTVSTPEKSETVAKPEGEPSDSVPPASERNSEPIPVLDVPPEIKDFGRNFTRAIRDFFPRIRSLAGELYTSLRSFRQRPANPATTGTQPPVSEAGTQAEGSASAAAPSNSSKPPRSLPPARDPSRPTEPASPPALLQPTEERLLFRRVETPCP